MHHIIYLFEVYSSVVFSIFTELCHHHRSFQNVIITPVRSSSPVSNQFSFAAPPAPWQPPTFLFLWIHLFWTFDINGIIHDVAFCVCFLSLRVVCLRFIHVLACIGKLLSFICAKSLQLCLTLCDHSPPSSSVHGIL